MFHSILSKLHEIPIFVYIIIIIVLLVLWTVLAYLLRNRSFWKDMNTVLLIITVISVIVITLAFRQYSERMYSLIPFSSFEAAKTYPDVYQQMMLNVVLFLPLGMTLPFALNARVKRPIIVTVVFAVLFSAVIESMQFVLMRGYAEIDDVIFNTLGAVLGVIPYMISNLLYNNTHRKKDL